MPQHPLSCLRRTIQLMTARVGTKSSPRTTGTPLLPPPPLLPVISSIHHGRHKKKKRCKGMHPTSAPLLPPPHIGEGTVRRRPTQPLHNRPLPSPHPHIRGEQGKAAAAVHGRRGGHHRYLILTPQHYLSTALVSTPTPHNTCLAVHSAPHNSHTQHASS